LKINGADIVIKDMGEISCEDVERWFSEGLIDDMWTLSYFDYALEEEGTRETLCTVGNGYFGTRGALEETEASDTNYPGTYIAGVYNRLESEVVGRIVVNEDFVNCPNWLPITYKLEDGDWLDLNTVEIIRFSRRLDFRDGVLHREVVVRDDSGRETLIESSRFVSMAQPHLAVLKYSVTPLNYAGDLSIRSGLNGRIINAGVERYRQLSSKHLEPVHEDGEANTSCIVVQTNQSEIQIAQAAKLFVFEGSNRIHPDVTLSIKDGAVYSTFDVEAKEGHPIRVEKVVAIYTSKDEGVKHPVNDAQNALQSIGGFDELHQTSAAAWADIWGKIDIQIEGDRLAQKLLRLNQYHSMISASPHNVDIDAGIPARGLHGEAYRGHIFWDEIYILPLYAMHFPDVTRSVLLYRYRRLNQAKADAEEHGYIGAMFPWQSGSDGREETQVLHLNPISGKWGPDYSSLQRHISLAIAYNIWQYWWLSNDIDFLEKYGAEMFLEICRFWDSKASYNGTTNRYVIDKIMGPDEYHEQYPGSDVGGLKNNSYTNLMVVWVLNRAFEILDAVSGKIRLQLLERIELSEEDLERWRKIAGRMCIPLSEDGILEQFEGYFKLKELDWDAYRKKHGDIRRLDRILKAEGSSPDAYKVAKQADALMAFYILDPNGAAEILEGAGYPIEGDMLHKNFYYYFPRTSHGSTLSNLVHSYLANLIGDRQLSWQLYLEALKSDYVDIQGGTTKEGAHIGVMAGTAVLALRAYAGLNLNGDRVCIDPRLPKSWRQMHFNFRFKGDGYSFVITPEKVEVSVDSSSKSEIDLFICGRRVMVRNLKGETIELPEREQV
jgi:trehalose/maltose hydrolase-like predicted phosphorylase